jgi:glycerol uptake facilitator-like aquaporin
MPDGQPGLASPPHPWRLFAEGIASGCLVFGIQAAGLPLAPLDAAPIVSALLRSATLGVLVATVLSTVGQLASAEVHPLLTVGSLVANGRGVTAAASRLAAQCVGALAGGCAARMMLAGRHAPSELLTTAGLVREAVLGFALALTATGAARTSGRRLLPTGVGLVSGLAYWMSGSTSAAHPLVLLVRAGCDGAPAMTGVLAAAVQVLGAAAAAWLSRWLFRPGLADRT